MPIFSKDLVSLYRVQDYAVATKVVATSIVIPYQLGREFLVKAVMLPTSTYNIIHLSRVIRTPPEKHVEITFQSAVS